MIPLRWRRAEHDQFPLIADFVESEDVHAIVIRSDFDLAIAGSVPLIHDFYDVDPTLAPIKTSGRRFEIHVVLGGGLYSGGLMVISSA